MDFSDLALAKFLQVAPELGSMILNFSELTEELGDSDMRVGVFSLRIGEGVAFIPVVAQGDNIFPIDSIFVEDEAQFKPLTKSTINSLLNSVSMSPGKSAKIPKGVDRNPSVYNMINPPRTGKFVYASTSRLTEFLSILPDHLKQFTFEKISSDKTVYESLDKIFGLKTIFEVLQPTKDASTTMLKADAKPVSVITGPGQLGAAFTEAMAQDVVSKGFTIQGNPEFSRVAISYQPHNTDGTYQEISASTDAGQDYNIVFSSGHTEHAYLPKSHVHNHTHGESLALFASGDYAKSDRFIAAGDSVDRTKVLEDLFQVAPPKLLKDLERGSKFIVFTTGGQYLGPFHADSVVQNNMGVEVGCYDRGIKKICGYRNYTQETNRVSDTLFIPYNAIIICLGANRSCDLERSAFDASRKKEICATQFLGAELNLRYDGVEFSANGQALGVKSAAMKYLVEGESLSPDLAENFIKQAEQVKSVKIFMSKLAASTDANPTEIPNSGNPAPTSAGDVARNGAFMPAVQGAAQLGDGQVLEATVISQLLQTPDLFEFIGEYLPELSETVDKLGRVLFLSRIKLGQLSESLDPDSVFALISQIKNVYKQLGDTVEKLKGISAASAGFDPKTNNRQGNGT